jgi:photosystem II stability/assembly factor-like uncharacterized protein
MRTLILTVLLAPVAAGCGARSGAMPCDPEPCPSGVCVGHLCVVESCQTDTCTGHGECSEAAGVVTCTCDPERRGERCEQCRSGLVDYGDGACLPQDPCTPDDPCAALHRACHNQAGAGVCGDCLAGFLPIGGDTCVPCSGTAGTFKAQTLTVAGEKRSYYLYVPDAYDCTGEWPALFDLHGTAGPPAPEEAYGLDGAVATAAREGFILARPRSRSSLEGGSEIFRWDQNNGDPARNATFVRALLDDLQLRYHLATDRLYVMGFSSGTNQTSVLAAQLDSPFSGYGFVGGGAWTVDSIPGTSSRFYLTTGFRDYMLPDHQILVALLDWAAVAEAARLVRATDNGHDLYAWMYDELWPFLDRGERPPTGSLRPGWTPETVATSASLLALTPLPGGDLLATGEHASLVRRAGADGTWSEVPVGGSAGVSDQPLTAVCLTDGGLGVAVGGGQLVLSRDHGATWAHGGTVPDLSGTGGFSFAYLNGIDCTGPVVGGGYWSGASSADAVQWTDVDFDVGGYRAQVAAVRGSPRGTWLAVGYYAYLARSTDGVHFDSIDVPADVEWLLDSAPVGASGWVVVGDGGVILRSTDDGLSFHLVHEAAGADLYAVRFRDAQVGLAVGLRGRAFLTRDGGATWTDAASGIDRFLGDVAWLADGTAVVVGEAGTALRFAPY